MSSKVPYFHVDAFTAQALSGNQAAVMMLEAWPDDATLQAIGAENMFAETAFLVPDHTGAADFELRWFTPAVEVAMCGHATLASGHVVLEQDPMLGRVTFATRKAGVLEVARDGDRYVLSLPTVQTALGAFDAAVPLLGTPVPHEVWQCDGYNVFVYASADDVLALSPDFKALLAFGDVQFIATAPGAGHASGADVVSRVFVPGGGIDEDAATGSAHAALTPIWAQKLGRTAFAAHQASARGADFACRLEADRVLLGGDCVTVVEGLFRLP
ncbi:MAG: PhzF family phenazine biosynthesis protein [Novosphingobium sp. 28-62-57]|uniref:PhzF family phenazine biosynthesis protein n=1 Tax=unclassified Novosphingobium TaxID=2644732 RepID=UPI000BCA5FB8|nr:MULTISPECIES: PhzF family phenazine biosynthesis protein [unclassified Novosphingobium]OYW50175.1 MAG: PhzF family phenazine biosynthesis protein [Novosphingobium sp. 12-62-10]OYZ11720.1 MAG: PhzF family phenazine biosynthesis protein [Novosphingobium sp. 28-62-57]OZA31794.1 MAG: PhzF family phenazine biosynthesis protein [Novosphingobium sp. 17-62-9]HQS69943.1 PhzF family phenazine biosynthesis protein [Novosphingobium sp.]